MWIASKREKRLGKRTMELKKLPGRRDPRFSLYTAKKIGITQWNFPSLSLSHPQQFHQEPSTQQQTPPPLLISSFHLLFSTFYFSQKGGQIVRNELLPNLKPFWQNEYFVAVSFTSVANTGAQTPRLPPVLHSLFESLFTLEPLHARRSPPIYYILFCCCCCCIWRRPHHASALMKCTIPQPRDCSPPQYIYIW